MIKQSKQLDGMEIADGGEEATKEQKDLLARTFSEEEEPRQDQKFFKNEKGEETTPSGADSEAAQLRNSGFTEARNLFVNGRL